MRKQRAWIRGGACFGFDSKRTCIESREGGGGIRNEEQSKGFGFRVSGRVQDFRISGSEVTVPRRVLGSREGDGVRDLQEVLRGDGHVCGVGVEQLLQLHNQPFNLVGGWWA